MYLPLTENVDYLPISAEFVFSQQQEPEQCAPVRLLEDENPSEGTELFNVVLSMSSPVTNVILDPIFATVSISDSVTSILTDLSGIAGGNEQTQDNLQFIGGVVEDIANSASNGDLEINMEVCSHMPCLNINIELCLIYLDCSKCYQYTGVCF